MVCKFCQQEKKLISAHIIPYSFYKSLKSGGSNIIQYSRNLKEHKKRSPKGVYDQSLVCANCETIFDPYDNYAKRFLLDEFPQQCKMPPEFGGRGFLVQEFDYEKLKLFFISLLWRASVTSREFYNKIAVGSFFEKELKKNIVERNAGSANDFAVILAKYIDCWADKGIIAPVKIRLWGRTFYRFYLGGFSAQIKVDSQPIPHELERYILRPSSPLIIFRGEMKDCGDLHSFMESRRHNT